MNFLSFATSAMIYCGLVAVRDVKELRRESDESES